MDKRLLTIELSKLFNPMKNNDFLISNIIKVIETHLYRKTIFNNMVKIPQNGNYLLESTDNKIILNGQFIVSYIKNKNNYFEFELNYLRTSDILKVTYTDIILTKTKA